MTTLRRHLATDRLYGAWRLTLLGLRRSELLGLRWSDIDLATGTLTIERGRVLVDGGKRTAEDRPKTRRGTRTIPLPLDVLKALRSMRESQLAGFGATQVRSGYVVVDEIGEPMRHEAWSDAWKRHCKAAGVPVVNLHGARHSAITTLREAGVPDHIVAALAGHDEVVMRRTYSHAQDEGLANAARTLSEAYGGFSSSS
jgi:integrase